MDRRSFIKSTAAVGALALIPLSGSIAKTKTPGTAALTTHQNDWFPTQWGPVGTNPLVTVEVYDKGKWVQTPWGSLKKMDIFRLRYPTGDFPESGQIKDAGNENEIAIALSDARSIPVKEGSWTVRCDPFTIITKDIKLNSVFRVMKGGQQMSRVHQVNLSTHMATVDGLTNEDFYYNWSTPGHVLDAERSKTFETPFDYIECVIPPEQVKRALGDYVEPGIYG